MGFTVPRRQGHLVFSEDADYEGAEVMVNLDSSMGLLFEINDLEDRDGDSGVKRAIEAFAEHVLVSWNLEDEGEAIPATPQGMGGLPLRFGLACINAWTEAVATPASPLDQSSNGMPTLAAVSTPLDGSSDLPEPTSEPA